MTYVWIKIYTLINLLLYKAVQLLIIDYYVLKFQALIKSYFLFYCKVL